MNPEPFSLNSGQPVVLHSVYELCENFLERRTRDRIDLISDTNVALLQVEQATKIDGSGNHHDVAGRLVDSLFQFVPLSVAVAHRRKHAIELRIFLIRLADRSNGKWPRIDALRRSEGLRRHDAGSVRHSAMGKRRSVLYDQYFLSTNQVWIVDRYAARSLNDGGFGIAFLHIVKNVSTSFGAAVSTLLMITTFARRRFTSPGK